MHQVVILITVTWLLISVQGSVEPFHRTRSPACEKHIGRLAMQDILLLRDLFQLWTQNKRIEVCQLSHSSACCTKGSSQTILVPLQMDMEDLLETIREPPTDEAEANTWKTSWSAAYVEERMNNATNTLKDIDAEVCPHLHGCLGGVGVAASSWSPGGLHGLVDVDRTS